MKNKKMLLRLGLFAMVIWCLGLSTASATRFNLNIEKIESLSKTYLSNKIIPIHFADNWNDFGWFFYFSNGIGEDEWIEWETPEEQEYYGISIRDWSSITEYECNRQVKWFYYNAERGERLRPLDKETRATGLQNKITTSWWLYTVCSESWYVTELKKCLDNDDEHIEDCKANVSEEYSIPGYWYYGQVTHTYSWQKMVLTVWVKYDTESPKFVAINATGWFSPSFTRVGNQYPAWFIYDQNWWVGFVWCKIVNPSTITGSIKKLLFNYNKFLQDGETNDPLSKMFYETGNNIDYKRTPDNGYQDVNNVSCSNAVRDALLPIVIEWIVWMGASWNMSNFEYIWNQQDPKMQYFSSADINNNTIINYARKKAELLCRWKWPQNGCTSVANNIQCCKWDQTIEDLDNNTYIVKNWNVTIKPFDSYTNPNRYDVFIDSWNLVINETDDKFVFNSNWFPVNSNTADFSSDVTGSNGDYEWDNVAIGSFIRWNFIVNWRIKWPEAGSGELKNKYFIHWKVSTRDTFSSLTETFGWRCINWRDTNGEPCPLSRRNDDGGSWRNPYEVAALVIIDQDYKSPLFNN